MHAATVASPPAPLPPALAAPAHAQADAAIAPHVEANATKSAGFSLVQSFSKPVHFAEDVLKQKLNKAINLASN